MPCIYDSTRFLVSPSVSAFTTRTLRFRFTYGDPPDRFIDEPVMRAGGSGDRYYHRNQQYSITALTDSNGNVTERYAYTAYGTPTITDAAGTTLTTSADNNRYTYTGREWDESLDLYHYRARMYDAISRRFLGRDPIKNLRTIFNLYAGAFAAKGALDPGGNDWVMPWNPNAQWWYPFSAINPYGPPPPAPAPQGSSAIGSLIARTPPWMLLLAPCIAGALGSEAIDLLIEYFENGTIPNVDAGRRICAAVSGCAAGVCTVVLTVGILGTTATCGAYLLVGGTTLVGCVAASSAVCQMCDDFVGSRNPPAICRLRLPF